MVNPIDDEGWPAARLFNQMTRNILEQGIPIRPGWTTAQQLVFRADVCRSLVTWLEADYEARRHTSKLNFLPEPLAMPRCMREKIYKDDKSIAIEQKPPFIEAEAGGLVDDERLYRRYLNKVEKTVNHLVVHSRLLPRGMVISEPTEIDVRFKMDFDCHVPDFFNVLDVTKDLLVRMGIVNGQPALPLNMYLCPMSSRPTVRWLAIRFDPEDQMAFDIALALGDDQTMLGLIRYRRLW